MNKKISRLSFVILLLLSLELTAYLFSSVFQIYEFEMISYQMSAKKKIIQKPIVYSNKPNHSASYMGVEMQFNNDGLRDSALFENNRQKKAIFLGDSLTLGWGVEQTNTFTSIVDKNVPHRVFNFGVANSNTEQQKELFLHFAKKYNPEYLFLFYFINDAEAIKEESIWSYCSYSKFFVLSWMVYRKLMALLNFTPNYKQYYKSLYKNGDGWNRAQNSILQLREYAHRQGIKFSVILLPDLHQLSPYAFDEEHRKIMNFLAMNRIRAWDLQAEFESEDSRILWVAPDDPHPNRRAHKLIADKVIKIFEELGL